MLEVNQLPKSLSLITSVSFSMLLLVPSALSLWSIFKNAAAKLSALMSSVSLLISYTVHGVVALFHDKLRKSFDTVTPLKVKI